MHARNDDRVLNYHLMHPGGDSSPGDPNAAFYLDGVYHLHYILNAISGGQQQPLFKSTDLHNWTLVGDFMSHALPGTMIGEDISCPNIFRLGDKWMLLCISHSLGNRRDTDR